MDSQPPDDIVKGAWATNGGSSPNHSTQGGGRGDPLRGVSVQYLSVDLLGEVLAAGLPHRATVREIEKPVIWAKGAKAPCPRDGRPGCAYVDLLSTSPGGAGRATFMLSYTWDYAVSDVCDTLSAYCQQHRLDTSTSYMWICCLCINQHRVQEARARGESVPCDKLTTEFGSRLRSIRHMLALMEPWQRPKSLRRVWCIFELHMALELGDTCKLEILMPPRDAAVFMASIYNGCGLGEVWKAFSDVRVEHAESSMPQDKTHICRLVQENPGYAVLNEKVISKLQQWFLEAAAEQVQFALKAANYRSSNAQACAYVAELFTHLNRCERAISLLSASQDALTKSACFESEGGAELLRSTGIVKWKQGKYKEALVCFSEARYILEKVGKLRTQQGAQLLRTLALMKIENNDVTGAMTSFDEAYRLFETSGKLESAAGALFLMDFGRINWHNGNRSEALECVQHAKRIRAATGTLETPDGIVVLMSEGALKHERGDYAGARSCYSEAKQILERTGMMQTRTYEDCISRLEALNWGFFRWPRCYCTSASCAPFSDVHRGPPTSASSM